MSLLKFGEALNLEKDAFISPEAIKADKEIHDKFVKLAANIKKIAPNAEDFLYFTAIMMHAAERSIYDEDGNIRKNADGSDVSTEWETNEKTGSWKWNCSDRNIKPYKNSNGDIFPEIELKKAYKKWVGKPLCQDHQSSTVDGVRGLIIDTYWDDKFKRIIALCALDKVNFPTLARNVKTGVSNSVSMGTAVGKSICTECGKVARTEHEYCQHVTNKTAYGEINVDLQPLELSVVVNGADTRAKVLEVLAAANQIQESIIGNVELSLLKEQFEKLSSRVLDLEKEILSKSNDNNFALKRIASEVNINDLGLIREKMSSIESTLQALANKFNMEDLMSQAQTKQAYFLGTEEPTLGKPRYPKEEADKIRNTEDSHMKLPLTDLGPVDGVPKQDLDVKQKLSRAAIEERRALRAAAVEKAQSAIKNAYHLQGDDKPAKTDYPVDPGAKIRDTEFKFNPGQGTSGAWDDDEKVKKELCRAELAAKLVKGANAGENKWEIFDKNSKKILLTATFDELTGNRPSLYETVAQNTFAKKMMKDVKAFGIEGAIKIHKGAQDVSLPAPTEMPVEPSAPTEMPAMPAELEEGMPAAEAVTVDPETVQKLQDAAVSLTTAVEELTKGKDALAEETGLAEITGPADVVAQAAIEDLQSPEPKNASQSLSVLRTIINAGLRKSFKKNIKNAKAAKDAVNLILSMKESSINKEFLTKMADETLDDVEKVLKKAQIQKASYVKYAKGTYQLEKKAAEEANMNKKADADVTFPTEKITAKPPQKPEEKKPEEKKPVEPKKPEEKKPEPKTADAEFDMTTIEGRKAYRQKLAASASNIAFSDMIGKAHPKSDTALKDIGGTKEAVVEGIDTVNKQMMSFVHEEPKAKKAAQQLDNLIKAGEVKEADLDDLVKEGLDKTVVDYWKKYYSQTEGGSEFATALTKDYSSAKASSKSAEEITNYKAKYAKAYELAYEMADVGLCARTKQAIKDEAEKIVAFDDNAFESVQKVVAHHAAKKLNKSASVQVGVSYDSDSHEETMSGDTLYNELSSYFAGKKY